ncbi:alcohol dehydrogenase family protein [Litorisediminicola beolgyonensis]|uniref:Alcohol dehydrogenase family protein n=2 Tax=Litorisediminicola beolgyonensis TaxID=1173614 RepID=A0ABW3ZJP6_9RHOB
MFGVVLTGHGGPEALVWRDDLPRPEALPGEVLIRVGAAAVNNTDVNTRLAWYASGDGMDQEDAAWSGKPLEFPRIQGADVCGEIVAVGADVPEARIGERVIVEPSLREAEGARRDPPWYFGTEVDGGFAEYATVAARHAHRIVSDLTDIELASFPCSYSTAENLLTRAGVTARDRVLVTGASGGVGSAAVQLAVARGAEVIGIASAAKAPEIEALGAARVLDRDADLAATLGTGAVDVVIDLVGGPGWPPLLDLLRPGGRYAISGAIAGPEVTLDLRKLYLKDLSFFGCTVLQPGVFEALVERIETGAIRPLVAASYPLRDIGAAQEAFQAKRHVGKIVLEVRRD